MKAILRFSVLVVVIICWYTYGFTNKRITIAVADFGGRGLSKIELEGVSEFIRTGFVNTELLDVVDRRNMDMVLEEQKFQLSGCTDQECAVKMGKLLNVQKIVTGKIIKMETDYYVTANVVDVETGRITVSERTDAPTIKKLIGKSDELALAITNRLLGIKIFKVHENVETEKTLQGETPGSNFNIPLQKYPETKTYLVEKGLDLTEIKPLPPSAPYVPKREKIILNKREIEQMAYIPAGEFLMGSPEGSGKNDEHPEHKVYLDAFYIDKYEVTNEQYAKFLNKIGTDTDEKGNKMINESKWGLKYFEGQWTPASGYEKTPVVVITWYGANLYAKYYGKRLPTEAEWEKACKAGSSTKYFFGDNASELVNYAWYDFNSRYIVHPVGEMKPNAYGIFDMAGNVWEWCADWYDEKYYLDSSYENPKGADRGIYRVLRGGSQLDSEIFCRSSSRYYFAPDTSHFTNGFRCAADSNINSNK